MVLNVHDPWPALSPRGAELFREAARLTLDLRGEWVGDLHAATLGSELARPIAEDPVLAEGNRRTNTANVLQWATANVRHPGRRVPPSLGPESLANARDLVRRGLDTVALDSFRTAQSVAWRHWMDICFGLTSDPAELRELFEVSNLSISTFLDDTIAAVSARMAIERADLTSGTQAERRATIALLLEGAPIVRERAEAQLGYRFDGEHTAVILWSVEPLGSQELEPAAEAVMKACGAHRRLTVVASAESLWLWLPVPAPTSAQLAAAVSAHPRIRVAAGRSGTDVEGFRRSHLDAGVAQQLLSSLASRRQVATFADVRLVNLMAHAPAKAEQFVTDTLGALAEAEPELREFVLTYIREHCNASRAAERLYTHRNTVLRRLARADELLPRPLADNVVHIAAALEFLAWRGART